MSESIADRFPAGAIHNGRVQDERGEADEFRACFDHLATWAEEAKAALDATHAEIARLTADNERLTRERDRAQATADAHVAGWTKQCEANNVIARERNAYKAGLTAMEAEVNEQAEDECLWCIPGTIVEDHMQRALRRLHAAIEGKSPDECAREALAALPPAAEAKEPCEVCGDTGSIQDDECPYLGHACPRCQKPPCSLCGGTGRVPYAPGFTGTVPCTTCHLKGGE